MRDLDEAVRHAALPTADTQYPQLQRVLETWPERLRAVSATPAVAHELRRRRRLRRRTIGVALTVATAVAAPVAAATVIAAHTGRFGHGGEEGTGEMIRLDSPQFPQVLDRIRQQEALPLPAGSDWTGLLGQFEAVHGPSLESTSGLAGVVEMYAQCRWQGAFITATRSGDSRMQREAAAVIGRIPMWPQMRRQADPTFQQVLRAEAAAAARGDAGRYSPNAPFEPGNIAQHYEVNCTGMQVGR
jgi:hypothetical protein